MKKYRKRYSTHTKTNELQTLVHPRTKKKKLRTKSNKANIVCWECRTTVCNNPKHEHSHVYFQPPKRNNKRLWRYWKRRQALLRQYIDSQRINQEALHLLYKGKQQ